jgi:hypothetical protein
MKLGKFVVKREDAIAFLKEITANHVFLQPNWISLVNGTAGYEVHIKPDDVDLDLLKPVVKTRALSLKEANGLIIIHG